MMKIVSQEVEISNYLLFVQFEYFCTSEKEDTQRRIDEQPVSRTRQEIIDIMDLKGD